MQQLSGRKRRRVTCWESRLTVADGGARVLVCGLREGEPRVSTAQHRAQSMCRREEEADEASPRRLVVPLRKNQNRAKKKWERGENLGTPGG